MFKTVKNTLHVFDEIGVGYTADDVIAELGNAHEITVKLDSPGGDTKCGLALCDFFQARNAVVEITGRCGSAAVFAMMGAKRIRCISSARILVHAPSNCILGTAQELRDAAASLDKLTARIEAIFAARTKQPIETVRSWFAGEDRWFSAAEAFAAGLVDEVFDTAPVTAPQTAGTQTGPSFPSEPPLPESEMMFRELLGMCGKVEVASREKFMRHLVEWALTNTKETQK